jgi:hypothetical protein
VVCKWTDSPTMDCPDVCLKAFWLQEWEWVLEDCHKRSCWKNSLGVGVPRPCGPDVYVCSKSCRLCLTVVYCLLECNKVPSWIENPENVTIFYILILWYFISYIIYYCKFEPYTDVLVFITDDGNYIGRNASGLWPINVLKSGWLLLKLYMHHNTVWTTFSKRV